MNHDISNSSLFDDLRDTLHFQMHRIHALMFRNGNHLMQKSDIPLQMEQLPVLMIICAKKDMSQQEVADILNRDKSSIQRTIVTMEKKGFVTVSQDAKDKRRNIVNSTKSGHALAVKLKNITKQIEKETMKAFSIEERDATIKTLKNIADRLEEKNK